jgi:cytochrome oxidase Cu insertion factor (SCO1/SenC/PrrC family)
MTTQTTEPTPETACDPEFARARRLRLWMRLSGLMMWILVIVAGVYIYPRLRERSADAPPVADAGLHVQQADVSQLYPYDLIDFELTDHSGRTVTKDALLGRPWVASFIFTKCGATCPMITGQMQRLHDQMENLPVKFVSITVDPENDTTEELSKYAANFGADPERWLFLTGEKSQIFPLIVEGFKLAAGEGTDEPFHTNRVAYVNSQGQVGGTYMFNSDEDMVALRRAIRAELKTIEAEH